MKNSTVKIRPGADFALWILKNSTVKIRPGVDFALWILSVLFFKIRRHLQNLPFQLPFANLQSKIRLSYIIMLKSNPCHLGIAGKNPALGPPKSALGLELRSTASGRFWRPEGWIISSNPEVAGVGF